MAKMFLACFSLFVFLGSVLAATDFLSPLTPHGCASDEFGSTACNAGDYSQCCPYGSLCCAGGCCAAGSLCVNAGTSKEGCCSIFSANLCGADLTVGRYVDSTRQSGKGTDLEQSVSNPVFCIDGIEGGSYWCPAGSECAQDGTCNGASGADKPPLAKVSRGASNPFICRDEVFGSDGCGTDGKGGHC